MLGAYSYHNGVSTQHVNNPFATHQQYIFIYPGDSITLYGYGSGGTCAIDIFTATFNGNVIADGSGSSFTVHNEGLYHLKLICETDLNYAFIATGNPADTIAINQLDTVPGSLTEKYFGIVPSLSGGMYFVRNENRQLKRVEISDAMGRIIYYSGNPVSEIDLTRNPEGIYFYRMEDQVGNCAAGKIIKE